MMALDWTCRLLEAESVEAGLRDIRVQALPKPDRELRFSVNPVAKAIMELLARDLVTEWRSRASFARRWRRRLVRRCGSTRDARRRPLPRANLGAAGGPAAAASSSAAPFFGR